MIYSLSFQCDYYTFIKYNVDAETISFSPALM